MALERLKVVEACFMTGRGTAGKRFLTHRRHPVVQLGQQLGCAESQEYAASPASTRRLT
jgi:hypothetical protein